jgi:hypothetical protein
MAVHHHRSQRRWNAFPVSMRHVWRVLMRKIVTAGLAALTLAGGAMATTSPATAQSWRGEHEGFRGGDRGDFRGFRGRGDRDDDGGAALLAGVLGFGLGAALASPRYEYRARPHYYEDDGYYGVCYARERVWDPYIGQYVIERVRYAC